MRKIFAFSILVFVASVPLWSCEKDDICAEGTPTTPSMVVEFFMDDNTSQNNPITNLKYFVEGMEDTITIAGSTSKIRVPLRVDATSTKWGFVYTFTPTGATEPVTNIDFLEFKYTTQQTYISRACGFKTSFYLDESVPGNLNPVHTDGPGESNLWIQDVQVEKTNIEDENETHINIYF